MEIESLTVLRNKLEQEVSKQKELVTNGFPKDYESYKYHIGIIHGIQQSIELLNSTIHSDEDLEYLR